MNECYLEDDGGPQVCAVEEAGPGDVHRQSLYVQVGPVFRFSRSGERAEETGIWIQYQVEHDYSDPEGPVLLTPAVWRQLNRAVERRLRRKGYGKWRTLLRGVTPKM